VLLVDTVGFIQKLPHSLVAAFRATLEEVNQADLLVHVMDASAADVDEREAAVNGVLKEIGAEGRETLVVLNKCDAASAPRVASLAQARPGAVRLSARTGAGLDALRAALLELLDLAPRLVRLRFSAADSRGIAAVYQSGRVVAHEVCGDDVTIAAAIPGRLVARFQSHVV
jgi:GTP-binding protein HflX